MPFLSIYCHKDRRLYEWIKDDKPLRIFQPLEDYHWDTIAHFFMKRFRESYEGVMFMDTEARQNLFKWEMEIVEKENENNK